MKTVLFLGVNNATRTQMAEAILRHRAGDRFKSCSAGLAPRRVHPMTRYVLNEIGIASDLLVAKDLRCFLGRSTVDVAIILSQPHEPDSPRIYPFALQVEKWPFEDPASAATDERHLVDVFRRVRDGIDQRIQDWLEKQTLRKEDQIAVFESRGRLGEAGVRLTAV
ncbi:MAG: arsenate reductase ArsC [Phycisphaerae bacterium]